MENECSSTVKSYLNNNNIELQIVPPNLHRTNAAEKEIGLFKDHFISGLATVHPSFPLHLWCRLITLAFTKMNLLRQFHINPKLSAYEILNGVFDYNKTPPCASWLQGSSAWTSGQERNVGPTRSWRVVFGRRPRPLPITTAFMYQKSAQNE